MTAVATFSRNDLLTRLHELVAGSRFISLAIFEKAQLLPEAKLEKLLIVVSEAVSAEQKMTPARRQHFASQLAGFFQFQQTAARTGVRNFLEQAELRQREIEQHQIRSIFD